jgi:hypothetical protein
MSALREGVQGFKFMKCGTFEELLRHVSGKGSVELKQMYMEHVSEKDKMFWLKHLLSPLSHTFDDENLCKGMKKELQLRFGCYRSKHGKTLGRNLRECFKDPDFIGFMWAQTLPQAKKDDGECLVTLLKDAPIQPFFPSAHRILLTANKLIRLEVTEKILSICNPGLFLLNEDGRCRARFFVCRGAANVLLGQRSDDGGAIKYTFDAHELPQSLADLVFRLLLASKKQSKIISSAVQDISSWEWENECTEHQLEVTEIPLHKTEEACCTKMSNQPKRGKGKNRWNSLHHIVAKKPPNRTMISEND